MNKVVICSIPMHEKMEDAVYTGEERSVSASARKVFYPVNAFLENDLKKSDSVRFVLLTKKDDAGNSDRNLELFKKEFEEVNASVGAGVEYVTIDTAFSEEKEVHEELMGKLVDAIETGSHIMADITFGPKDLPIVVFTALNFAEKFLNCGIDHILYGKAEFKNGSVCNTRLCDMMPLYYLNSITNAIHGEEPDRARAMLRELLSI